MLNTHEVWKDVSGYEGLYQVSDQGRVRSLDRPRSDGRHFLRGKILKPLYNKKYQFVALWKNAASRQHQVHILVLTAFGGPRNGRQTNHKNGIRDDNRLENIEWVTQAENNLHAFRVLGRAPVIKRGEESGKAKLTNNKVIEMRRLRKQDPKMWTFERLARKFGINSRSHAKRIIDREVWSHI